MLYVQLLNHRADYFGERLAAQAFHKYKHVVCAVHHALHFTMFAAVRPDTWQHATRNIPNKFFLFLDSIGPTGPVPHHIIKLRNKLLESWNAGFVSTTHDDNEDWDEDDFVVPFTEKQYSKCLTVIGKTPNQTDQVNCGLYTAMNIEKYIQFVLGDGMDYTRDQIFDYYDSKDREQSFNIAEVLERRKTLAQSIDRYKFSYLFFFQLDYATFLFLPITMVEKHPLNPL